MMLIYNQLDNTQTMDPTTLGLGSLPRELIFRILDFMWPHEYSGFTYTCRRALAITNDKIDTTPDNMNGGLPIPVRWKSYTARFVDVRGLRLPPATVVESYMESDCSGSRLFDEFGDPDL